MINQDAIIYLNTPLIRIGDEMMESIIRVRGKVVGEGPQGYVIQVKAVGDEKKWEEETSFPKKIFLPLHKIDFIVPA